MTRIIVIGGGIAGISAAAELSKDAELTLLEAEHALGYHTSGRSAALTEKNYGAPSVQALNRPSFDVLQDNGYLSPRGLMVLGSFDEAEAFRRDVETLGTEEISVASACEMVPILNPDKIAYAGYHADAWDIDTDRLMQDYARQLKANGGQVVLNARVSAIERHAGGWRVTSTSGDMEADVIVNAAGAWADPVAALAGVPEVGITPYRRSIARIPAPTGYDVRDWPVFFGVGESWYAKPDAGFLLVSPADEDPAEPHDAWADDLTLAEGLARYEGFVSTPVTRIQSNWAGLRSFAPDRSLVLGPDPEIPSFIWCAGQGGYGFQTAPAAARLVSDLAFDRTPGIPAGAVSALTPNRLR